MSVLEFVFDFENLFSENRSFIRVNQHEICIRKRFAQQVGYPLFQVKWKQR